MFRRSWRTWLFALGAIFVVADVAYHLYGEPAGTAERTLTAPPAEATAIVSTQTGIVRLSPEQRSAGGIAVESVALKPHAETFRAPGEVRVNDYATTNVTSRLRATVIARRGKLGDRVAVGQVLVTLYSPEMAEAESTFVLASKTFARISNLKAYVSGQQFDEAEVKRDEARGRLETYGLPTARIADLAANGLSNSPAGEFELASPQAGVITTDVFRVGEVVEPGKALFEVSNLSSVWVEAKVSPEIASRISGNRAKLTAGSRTYDARIVQVLQQLDETTRTVGVRLEVANSGGGLKPGQYADVELYSASVPELFVPTVAVLRNGDGGWIVYVEDANGAFRPVPVQVLHASGDDTAITGIQPGTKIVTMGAFFVKSEAEKSAFGDKD